MFSLPESPTLKVALFVLAALGVSVIAMAGGAYLYELAAKPKTAFYAELGSLALQLGVAVIVGALIKVVVDWGLSQRARYNEKLEAKKEFMRRVRAMHVVIQNAKDLLNAHQSAKTWGEQSRRLMELRPEVEEISEDLKASHGLFAQQATIIEGLEAIIVYLTESGREYVDSHGVVDSDFKNGERLATTIHRTGMTKHQGVRVLDHLALASNRKSATEMESSKINGQCLCGEVQFFIEGEHFGIYQKSRGQST